MLKNKVTVLVVIISLLAGLALAQRFDNLWLLSGSGDAGSGLSLVLESLLAGSGDSGAGLG